MALIDECAPIDVIINPFSPTKWKQKDGFETVARFCFINPHTQVEDVNKILETMN